MAKLILNNLEPEILDMLELRAKRLGTTPEKEAMRLLIERLRTESEPGAATTAVPPTSQADAGLLAAIDEMRSTSAAQNDSLARLTGRDPADPRFQRLHGRLVFVGSVAPTDVPDHRALREERIDSLLSGIDDA